MSTVDRQVKKGSTDTLTAVFYDGGEVPVDKGAVTVSVASDVGTVLQTGSATNSSGTYTFTLNTTATANLDRLAVTWTASTAVQTTHVDVVGGFYFDLADLRAMKDLSSMSTYPTDRLRAARAWIEEIIDRQCGTSFVHRYHRDIRTRVHGLLSKPYTRSLLSVTVDDATVDLDTIALDDVGAIWWAGTGSRWCPAGYTSDIRYTAGWADACPGDLRDVALQAARWRLISTDGQSGIPSRATSITNEFGNVTLATASAEYNRPTGIPDVDAVIVDWARRVRVPAVA